MVARTMVLLEDDLDGRAAGETVSFALDGVSYEIDLSVTNAARLRKALAAYVGAGRRVGGRTVARRGGGGPARTDPEFAAIRAWARGRGLEVGDRGRIPSHITERYHACAAAPGPEPAVSDAPSPRRRARRTV